MSIALYLSMGTFALVSSITPGPVNVVALGSGVRHGFAASLRHVTGATAGFTLLLLLAGYGVGELLRRWPGAADAARWAGVVFLLHLAGKLWTAEGGDTAAGPARAPSLLHGAALQWLNPKAWVAAIAGVGAYAGSGGMSEVWRFAALYFPICYASIAVWAYAGTHLRHALTDSRRMRRCNRLMAALLVVSAAGLIVG